MPNWCENTVELTHEDEGTLERAEKAFREGGLLQEFIPVPKELYDTAAGSPGGYGVSGEYAKELQKTQQALNIKYFGSQDWYDYCVKWWGTKWDVGGEDGYIERTGNTLVLSFDSAWAPPIMAYVKLEELGFKVDAMYFEPGMGFCGRYADGYDDDYSIEGDSAWVRANIPTEIDEAFSISNNLAEDEEYETENEDEEKGE